MSKDNSKKRFFVIGSVVLALITVVLINALSTRFFGACLEREPSYLLSPSGMYSLLIEQNACENGGSETQITLRRADGTSDAFRLLRIPSLIEVNSQVTKSESIIFHWLTQDSALLLYPKGLEAYVNGQLKPLNTVENLRIEAYGAKFDLREYEL